MLYVDHPVHLVNLSSAHFVSESVVIWVLKPSSPLSYSSQNFFKDYKTAHVIRFCFFLPPFHSLDNVSHVPVTFATDKNETFLPFGIPLSFRSPSPLVSLQAVKER